MVASIVLIIPNGIMMNMYVNNKTLPHYFWSGLPTNQCMTQDLQSGHVFLMYFCMFSCFWMTDCNTRKYCLHKIN